MEIDAVLDDLGEPAGDALGPGWNISVATCPDAPLDFLTPEVFLEIRAWSDLPRALDPLLEKTARAILKRPSLRHLAWHTYRLAYQTTEVGFCKIHRRKWRGSRRNSTWYAGKNIPTRK